MGLARLVSAIQQEQLLGTLESLMVTPTTASVILLGSVVYDLIYVPIRTVIFLIIVSICVRRQLRRQRLHPGAADPGRVHPLRVGARVDRFGLRAHLPARLGRRSGLCTFALTFTSGAYFPLTLFPSWVAPLAKLNPIADRHHGMRAQLIGGAGWHEALVTMAKLVPLSAITLLLGLYAFRLAMRRERRLGTLGLY